MLKAVEVWQDSQTGGYIRARSAGRGNCVLEFHLADVVMMIESTRKAFIGAAVGAKTHFASSEGACEVCRQGDRLRITVKQWRGGKEQIEMDRLDFECALRSLADADASRVSLL